MSLLNITEWTESSKYLDNIRYTIIADVKPLLAVDGSAPFAISREFCSYVDHLGHLFSGYTGSGAVGKRLKKYLNDVLSIVDANYKTRKEEIYNMYRNGPIHEFKPKTLENRQGQLLSWFCYTGKRQNQEMSIQESEIVVTHLVPIHSGVDHKYWLPISTTCLVEDLIQSIEEFKTMAP
jgi:hypothetical protein